MSTARTGVLLTAIAALVLSLALGQGIQARAPSQGGVMPSPTPTATATPTPTGALQALLAAAGGAVAAAIIAAISPDAVTPTPTATAATATPPNTTVNRTPPTTTANAPAQANGTTGWAGTWNTDIDVLTLMQTGNQVTGAFQDQTTNPGAITGTVNGNVLTATWDVAPSTPGMFTIALVMTESTDGKSFEGTFDAGGGITGTWSGTRTGP